MSKRVLFAELHSEICGNHNPPREFEHMLVVADAEDVKRANEGALVYEWVCPACGLHNIVTNDEEVGPQLAPEFKVAIESCGTEKAGVW